jgi:hypothetical protein
MYLLGFFRVNRRSRDADRSFKKIPRGTGTEEKRRFIRDHAKKLGSVSKGCKVVGMPPSTYYYKIEQVYNTKRPHSSLGYVSPNEFELLQEKDGTPPTFAMTLPGKRPARENDPVNRAELKLDQ